MAGAWHGMCELTRQNMTGERHGNGMSAVWAQHGMCELALNRLDCRQRLTLLTGQLLLEAQALVSTFHTASFLWGEA
jgi:hypothetical protein